MRQARGQARQCTYSEASPGRGKHAESMGWAILNWALFLIAGTAISINLCLILCHDIAVDVGDQLRRTAPPIYSTVSSRQVKELISSYSSSTALANTNLYEQKHCTTIAHYALGLPFSASF